LSWIQLSQRFENVRVNCKNDVNNNIKIKFV
jgi:hypothetical protein